MPFQIQVDREKLAAFCRRNSIRKLSFFGSVLRRDFRSDSDVDVLVEYAPGAVVGYIRQHAIEEELSELLGGKKVDFVDPKFLYPRLERPILTSAEVLYAEG